MAITPAHHAKAVKAAFIEGLHAGERRQARRSINNHNMTDEHLWKASRAYAALTKSH